MSGKMILESTECGGLGTGPDILRITGLYTQPGRAGTKQEDIAVFCDNSHAACWNVGILEKWNIGLKIGMGLFIKVKSSVIPINAVSLIHHSFIPIQWICCGSQTKKFLS